MSPTGRVPRPRARFTFGRSPKSDQKVCLKPQVSRLPACLPTPQPAAAYPAKAQMLQIVVQRITCTSLPAAAPTSRTEIPPPRALYSKGTLRSSPYLHPPPFSLSPSPVPEGWVPQGRGRARPAPFGRLGDWDSPPQTPLFGHFLAAKKVTRARRHGPTGNCMKRTPSGVLFSCLCIFPHMPAVLPPGEVSPA